MSTFVTNLFKLTYIHLRRGEAVAFQHLHCIIRDSSFISYRLCSVVITTVKKDELSIKNYAFEAWNFAPQVMIANIMCFADLQA
jgi:hypothetical protein